MNIKLYVPRLVWSHDNRTEIRTLLNITFWPKTELQTCQTSQKSEQFTNIEKLVPRLACNKGMFAYGAFLIFSSSYKFSSANLPSSSILLNHPVTGIINLFQLNKERMGPIWFFFASTKVSGLRSQFKDIESQLWLELNLNFLLYLLDKQQVDPPIFL